MYRIHGHKTYRDITTVVPEDLAVPAGVHLGTPTPLARYASALIAAAADTARVFGASYTGPGRTRLTSLESLADAAREVQSAVAALRLAVDTVTYYAAAPWPDGFVEEFRREADRLAAFAVAWAEACGIDTTTDSYLLWRSPARVAADYGVLVYVPA